MREEKAHSAGWQTTLENMIAVGIKNKMKENRCQEIYKEITLPIKSGENVS